MLTSKYIKENLKTFQASCEKRQIHMDFPHFNALESRRLELIQSSETKKAELNALSKTVGEAKRQGKEPLDLMRNLQKLSSQAKQQNEELTRTLKEVNNFIYQIPNILDSEVPEGVDEQDNRIVRTVGEKPRQTFVPKPHYELVGKDALDFERATKMSGARFVVLRNQVARLERGLINFFLEKNIERGYEEIVPPTIVNEASVFGTGQLPKFTEDIFHLGSGYEDFYLIPTAEVPLTNLYRNEILETSQLPMHFTAISSCFRAEAGSAGRDTRGLMRLHEFKKVELVKICRPENSEAEHQAMVADAEALLVALEIPYRVSLLCAGDTGFSAKKCYDLEVWVPSEGKYREISSCSNCGDFQARRTNIRLKGNEKPVHVHTLNGSALPLGRTLIALLENHQDANAVVHIPKALQPYVGTDKISFS